MKGFLTGLTLLIFILPLSAQNIKPALTTGIGDTITEKPDSAYIRQLFYKGVIWRGLYYNIYGSEFLKTDDWIRGDIRIHGMFFKNTELKYDIFSDEILTNYYNKNIIILDKGSIEEFILYYKDDTLCFKRIFDHRELNGFYQIIYEGKSSLYKKWRKKRAQFAVEAKYDEFQDNNNLVLISGNTAHIINNRKDLRNFYKDKKQLIKKYIKAEKLNIDLSSPKTLIPLIKYYDQI